MATVKPIPGKIPIKSALRALKMKLNSCKVHPNSAVTVVSSMLTTCNPITFL